MPGDLLADARLLASELIVNSSGTEPLEEERSLRFAVQLRDGAFARRRSRSAPVPAGSLEAWTPPFGLQLVEALASRSGVDEAGGTHLWFEVDTA